MGQDCVQHWIESLEKLGEAIPGRTGTNRQSAGGRPGANDDCGVSRLPQLRPVEVMNAVKRAGSVEHHQTGSHRFFSNPTTKG